MSTRFNNLILISSNNIQSRALELCIPPKLKMDFTILDINSLPLKLNYKKDTLILIDMATLNTEHERLLLNKLKKCSASVALLNAKNDITLDEIVIWPNIYGYFSHHDSFDVICKGLQAMMAGAYWIPSDLIIQLIDHYRNHQINRVLVTHDSNSTISLTYREKEVLSALTNTTSNREIAHQLFLSECTIKSHLYNIFKKIQVKNRHQAIVWAKSNLH